jgi:sarcosine oxidase
MDERQRADRRSGPRIAVVGLGGIGGQVALALADRGAHVVGFDRYRPPHESGSSHGESRVIREAYAEGGQYVPLVRRAWRLWEQLEQRAGERLLHPTGGVHHGRPDGAYMTSLVAVAREYDIELSPLSLDDAGVFAPPPGTLALRERYAGWVAIERAVEATLQLAHAAGAELRLGVPVIGIERDAQDCAVVTAAERTPFDRIVVCAGAWTSRLLPELAPVLELERQTLVWFDPPRRAPSTVWLGEHAPDRFVYGFPPDRYGLKVAIHHDGPRADLDDLDDLHPSVSVADIAAVAAAANALLATPVGGVRRTRPCLYTNTPDRHFALGPLPADERIVVVSACSGHGFKFAPAIGEAVAALALGTDPPVDVAPFALDRPALAASDGQQVSRPGRTSGRE